MHVFVKSLVNTFVIVMHGKQNARKEIRTKLWSLKLTQLCCHVIVIHHVMLILSFPGSAFLRCPHAIVEGQLRRHSAIHYVIHGLTIRLEASDGHVHIEVLVQIIMCLAVNRLVSHPKVLARTQHLVAMGAGEAMDMVDILTCLHYEFIRRDVQMAAGTLLHGKTSEDRQKQCMRSIVSVNQRMIE